MLPAAERDMWKETEDSQEELGGVNEGDECTSQRRQEPTEKAQEVPEGWRKAKFIPLERDKGSSGNANQILEERINLLPSKHLEESTMTKAKKGLSRLF